MIKPLLRLACSPRHLWQHRNIFLLSHMRANTSLFGHILGSHPEIEGYYEMHIGYYSWKSLWRQKLLYLQSHVCKPTSRYFFDKLLHDYCVVAPAILARPTTRAIFMLRAPAKTIKSIVDLYRKNEPAHEFASVEGAAAYYIGRLNTLERLAGLMPCGFYYLDAEDLVDRPEPTLAALGHWLGLAEPLSAQYRTFNKTGERGAGDSSEMIRAGTIRKTQNSYADVQVPAQLLQAAEAAYVSARQVLSAGMAANASELPSNLAA